MDIDQFTKYERVRIGSLDRLFGDYSDQLRIPHKSVTVAWIHDVLDWQMCNFTHAMHILFLLLHAVPVVY